MKRRRKARNRSLTGRHERSELQQLDTQVGSAPAMGKMVVRNTDGNRIRKGVKRVTSVADLHYIEE